MKFIPCEPKIRLRDAVEMDRIDDRTVLIIRRET
jgi:hypothetical protein